MCVCTSQAARKRGKDAATVQSNLEALESILPNLINLHKMKAADWCGLIECPEVPPCLFCLNVADASHHLVH